MVRLAVVTFNKVFKRGKHIAKIQTVNNLIVLFNCVIIGISQGFQKEQMWKNEVSSGVYCDYHYLLH